MDGINNSKYPQEYLNGIQNKLTRVDKTGDKDGNTSASEVLEELDIKHLFENQSLIDKFRMYLVTKDMDKVVSNYAGEDGTFSAEEYADLINSEEWGKVMDVWHTSGAKAELEMRWTDNAGIKDGKATKGEVKVGLIQNLAANGFNIDTKELEALVDKYAGEDGTFSRKEYRAMLNDKTYQAYVDTYHITPWFQGEEQE